MQRELIEVAALKELFMMVLVVFLSLPNHCLVAFWPGVIGLHLTRALISTHFRPRPMKGSR